MQLRLVGDVVFEREGGPVIVVVVPESNAGQHVLGRLVEGAPVIDDVHVAVPIGPLGRDDPLVDAESPFGIQNQIGRQSEWHGAAR